MKKRYTLYLAAALVLAVMVSVAYAGLKTVTDRITYTDKQIFRSHVDLKSKLDIGSGVWLIHSPVIVSLSGTSVYRIDPQKGSYYWINDYQSTLGTRIASGVSIILPPITPDLDKYVVRIQKMTFVSGVSWVDAGTGTTRIVISTYPSATSGTTDGLWNVTSGATRESATRVMPEISEMDATGDWLEFTAMYNLTSGSSWFQTGRYIQ